MLNIIHTKALRKNPGTRIPTTWSDYVNIRINVFSGFFPSMFTYFLFTSANFLCSIISYFTYILLHISIFL